MDADPVSNKVAELLADFPDTPRSESSRILFRQSPVDWVATSNRQLRAGILNGDQETIDAVVDDVAHVIGKRAANWWMMCVLDRLVANELNSQTE